MDSYRRLLLNNMAWVEDKLNLRPDYFTRHSLVQRPEFLWIGCSDSRVPAEEVTGVEPGELFVHRNVANLVIHTDFNMLSVVQYAVEVLKVRHIIVCGHYGCSGVNAALHRDRVGLADNWLQHVQDVREKHHPRLECVRSDGAARCDRLCELNVIEQVANVCRTTIVRDAWLRSQELTVHGWIYGLKDGRLRDLSCSATSPETAAANYRAALEQLG